MAKSLALVAASGMLVGALVGCGGSDASSSGSTTPAAGDSKASCNGKSTTSPAPSGSAAPASGDSKASCGSKSSCGGKSTTPAPTH